ncbi:MAG: hypothetical protein Q8L37_01200 [Candidatus Gottesmanbacteria bacterium]|nr:hypothetical protein [Candidatus Gottesmanbacteria bacterium]
MTMLVARDENIKSTTVYVGYLILKVLKRSKERKITIFDAVEAIRGERGIIHYRQLMFALLFLYSTNVIDFVEPYIYRKEND